MSWRAGLVGKMLLKREHLRRARSVRFDQSRKAKSAKPLPSGQGAAPSTRTVVTGVKVAVLA